MKPRIYTDTSALGGCEDEEFRESSCRLVDAFAAGEFILVLSELVLRELGAAPDAVRRAVARVPDAHIELIAISPEAEELAAAYIQDGAIAGSMRADACQSPLPR